MKVLMLLTKQTTGGTIQLCYQWSRLLQSAGHEVRTISIISNDEVVDSPVVATIEKELGPIISLGHRRGSDTLRTVYRLRQMIRDYAPDVIHTYFPFAERIAALAYRGKTPIIGSVVATEVSPRTLKSRLADRAGNLAVLGRSSSRWLAVSHAVAEQAITMGYASNNIEVVYPYFDIESMTKRRQSVAQTAQSNEILAHRQDNPTDKFIVSVGRLVKVRQFDLVIEAFTLLPSRYRLYLIGEGPMRSELESVISTHNLADRVKLLGNRDDVPELLAAADVFVNASLSEGLLGYSTIEAIVMGIPIAVGKIPPIAEVISNDHGYLFDPTSAIEIANAILLASDASDSFQRREAALGRLKEVFDRTHILEALLHGYGATSS